MRAPEPTELGPAPAGEDEKTGYEGSAADPLTPSGGATGGIIPIGEAREMARRHDCPVVVIFAIEPEKKGFTVTTYGMTKKLCRHAADIGRQFAEAVMGEKVGPSQVEPLDLPEGPAVLARASPSAGGEGERMKRYRLALEEIAHAPTYDGSLCQDPDDCPNCVARAALARAGEEKSDG